MPSNASETPESGDPKEIPFPYYECPGCGHTCPKNPKDGMRDHHIARGYNFSCEHCDAKSWTAIAMVAHMKEEHPNFEEPRGLASSKCTGFIEKDRVVAQQGWPEVLISTRRKHEEEVLKLKADLRNRDGSQDANSVPVWYAQESHTEPIPRRIEHVASSSSSAHILDDESVEQQQWSVPDGFDYTRFLSE